MRAEGGLAVELELARERMPEARLQQPIGVEHLRAERAGDFGGGGGLAGAHEADEDERAGRGSADAGDHAAVPARPRR